MSHYNGRPTIKYYIENKLWPDINGNDHPIPAMETSHIVNCINRCYRENWRMSMVPVLLDELRSRDYDKTHPEYFI